MRNFETQFALKQDSILFHNHISTMKDTTRRTRLDLYDQIYDIRNRFEKMRKKH